MDSFSNLNKYESFADFISDAIKEKNITRQRLAELLDIHPAKVYRWVSGASLPKPDAVVRIAHFFNLSRDDINNLIEKQKKVKYKKRGRKRKKEKIKEESIREQVEIKELIKRRDELREDFFKIVQELFEIEVRIALQKISEEKVKTI